ncbi:MAG: MMPL family transporter [Euryarchaeota archaeon]|nr:MMPL family transporter [Euryarchaeota archaeon]
MGHGAGQKVPFEGLARAIGAVSLFASRNAKVTLVFIALVTSFFVVGATKLTTNVDVADVLPRGDGNTTAAHTLTDEFKSAFTQQVTLQFHVDVSYTGPTQFQCGPNWVKDNQEKLAFRRTTPQCGNITDEDYIRAVDQALHKIREYDELIASTIALSDLFRLINWTIAGGQEASDSAYSLPDTSREGEILYSAVHNGAVQAILSALDALSSPSWSGTAALNMPAADQTASMAEIGRRAIAARDKYLEWAESDPSAYKVFTGGNKPLITVELPVANAHSSELTKEDFSRLLPIIAAFIILCLFIAFRNVGATVIAFGSLAIGVVWTYGAEGFLGIPLNPLNLTLMPLIMGVGVDYSIHIVNEFIEHKAQGLGNASAFREVGRRAGVALFVGTATTVLGLIVMVVSPSALIAEFGALAAIAMAVIYVIALTFIPAALTLWPTTDKMGASFRPSRLIEAITAGVSRMRVVMILIVLALSIVGTIASAGLYNEAFGDPGRNYLRSDPVRVEHEQGLQWFYETPDPDVKANVIVFQGDLTDPAAHRYMRALEAELKKKMDGVAAHPRVIADTLRTIPFLMETWLTVKDGGDGALLFLAQGRTGPAPYPGTADEIEAEFNALYASPMKELGSIFTNGKEGGYDLGVMTFSVRAATYKEAEQVWGQIWGFEANGVHVPGALDNVSHLKPGDMKIAFVGNTATNYLFVAKEVPWVLYMGVGATFALMAIVIPFFRSFRAVLCVGVVSYATTAWWLGLLPSLGIGMAITLVIPIVFIIALGTDYSVHLIWSFKRAGNVREVFRTTGKSILFSWLTTIGPFLIFVFIQDLSVRKTMLATALAITIIFFVTIMTVPVFYPLEPRESSPPGAAPVDPPPATAARPAPPDASS